MADDFAAAAARHVIDSKALLTVARWDGAGYLAGYGVECALKLIIQVEGSNPKGHLRDISASAAQLAGLPGARTGKYITNPNIHSVPLSRPPGWAPDLRYEAEGSVDEAAARVWAAEAERLYTEIVLPMRLDGVI